MRYCLPPEETLPVAADLLASILPSSDYAARFAAALQTAGRALEA